MAETRSQQQPSGAEARRGRSVQFEGPTSKQADSKLEEDRAVDYASVMIDVDIRDDYSCYSGGDSNDTRETAINALDVDESEAIQSALACLGIFDQEQMARMASSYSCIPEATSSGFIRSSRTDDHIFDLEAPPGIQKCATQISRSSYYAFTAGLVVFIDFISICRDTDVKANAGPTDHFATVTMHCCFAFYIVDFLIHAVVHGRGLVKSCQYLLDLAIIMITLFEYALELVNNAQGQTSLAMVRMIRLCRLLRIIRVVKLFSGMKELRRLTQMIALCARTMFWSFLMSFVIMTMWAVMAVELAHPVAQELNEEGVWGDCDRCGRAFETVMSANLTFMQTILAGDSWGLLAIPILEASPVTAIIFCGALMTMTYGIMQLITAVVVDSFADLRKQDVNSLATEINAEEAEEKATLRRIFLKIDTDNSGMVTFEELAEGARRVKEFQDWLRVMDIDGSDLARLFLIIDSSDRGEVDLPEFMDALYRMRNAESKTTTKLVKHIVDNLERKTGQMFERIEDLQGRFEDMKKTQSQIRGGGEARCGSKEKDSILRHVEATVQNASTVALHTALTAALDRVQLIMRDGCGFHTMSTSNSKVSTGLPGVESLRLQQHCLEKSGSCTVLSSHEDAWAAELACKLAASAAKCQAALDYASEEPHKFIMGGAMSAPLGYTTPQSDFSAAGSCSSAKKSAAVTERQPSSAGAVDFEVASDAPQQLSPAEVGDLGEQGGGEAGLVAAKQPWAPFLNSSRSSGS
eukprot:TRINITY_DN19438_c0_g1_i1.p1 TRINITY_DN19438_c0_g1~~TRINITY_DN19438_c0_g1_i1.p1  ORF type:complete len:751 (-),score=153.48 TRINITY_DN19438_c0_g1_i1:281-2533(-)